MFLYILLELGGIEVNQLLSRNMYTTIELCINLLCVGREEHGIVLV